MNFKEQYKSTFSQIHASEELMKKLLEAKEMESKRVKITKNKKKITAMLIAAALAVTSAVAVSAGELNDAFQNFRVFVNGKEVSTSDYVSNDDSKLILHGNDEYIDYVIETSEDANIEYVAEASEGENIEKDVVTVCIVNTKDGSVSVGSYRAVDNYDGFLD